MCASVLLRFATIILQVWLLLGHKEAVGYKIKDDASVLCWIMTSPSNLGTRAWYVKATWGRRCNILLFMSSETNFGLPAIGLKVREGRDHLTAKTMLAFKYIYEHHFNDADWFMKADDDTYVIVGNLRYFLRGKNPKDPIYFGNHLKSPYISQGFYSGGAGYVISKEALNRLYHRGTAHGCREDGGEEDFHFGHCMAQLGVRTADSTDEMGLSLFHLFTPEIHVTGRYPEWYLGNEGGKRVAISDNPISFHYITPAQMYAMESYIFRLPPFGLLPGPHYLDFSSDLFKCISTMYGFLP